MPSSRRKRKKSCPRPSEAAFDCVFCKESLELGSLESLSVQEAQNTWYVECSCCGRETPVPNDLKWNYQNFRFLSEN